MKSPNGYGSIRKLSGNRRRPYIVEITTHYEVNTETRKATQKRATLGYYETKKDAMIALAEYNKNPYNADKNKATMEDIWNLIKEDIKVSDSRKEVYNRSWKKYFTDIKCRPISQIQSKELDKVFDECKYGYSTKVIIRTILKHIYEYAVKNRYTDIDLSSFIKLEQEAVQLERQVYTHEEIEKLWKYKDDNMYAIILILIHQGMRIKELLDFPVANIDMEAGTINITEAKNKQSERLIPIHNKVKPLIQRFIDNSDGVKLTNIKKNQLDYFCNKILNHTPYDTRHTFATKCNELDIKKVLVQRLMGHKPDSILEEYYTHLTIQELSDTLNSIEF